MQFAAKDPVQAVQLPFCTLATEEKSIVLQFVLLPSDTCSDRRTALGRAVRAAAHAGHAVRRGAVACHGLPNTARGRACANVTARMRAGLDHSESETASVTSWGSSSSSQNRRTGMRLRRRKTSSYKCHWQ